MQGDITAAADPVRMVTNKLLKCLVAQAKKSPGVSFRVGVSAPWSMEEEMDLGDMAEAMAGHNKLVPAIMTVSGRLVAASFLFMLAMRAKEQSSEGLVLWICCSCCHP